MDGAAAPCLNHVETSLFFIASAPGNEMSGRSGLQPEQEDTFAGSVARDSMPNKTRRGVGEKIRGLVTVPFQC